MKIQNKTSVGKKFKSNTVPINLRNIIICMSSVLMNRSAIVNRVDSVLSNVTNNYTPKNMRIIKKKKKT